MWKEGGEEEGDEGRRRPALRRPFRRPSPSGPRPVPFEGLLSVLSGTFACAVLWQGARSAP